MLPLIHATAATITIDGLDDMATTSHAAILAGMTGLAAVILALGMPVFIVAMVQWSRLRRQRLQNEVVLKLAEKGQSIPPELFMELRGRSTRSDLSSGLTLIGVGLGVALGLYWAGGGDAAGFALIPFFIGLARLIAWKLEQSQKNP